MIVATKKSARPVTRLPKLVREEIHGILIEYYPIGEHVVIQSGVQGGMPTIKNTRITAGVLVGWVEQGRSPADVAQGYRIPVEAVEEALALASKYDYDRSYA